MKIIIIVAVSTEFAIGKDGGIPWRAPKRDQQNFKELTLGKIVVMRRKTWESLKKPLPERTNAVITRDAHYQLPEGVLRFSSLSEALAALADKNSDIIIAGGQGLYAEAIPLADEIVITKMDVHVENADAFFPKEFNNDGSFTHHHSEPISQDDRPNGIIETWVRKTATV